MNNIFPCIINDPLHSVLPPLEGFQPLFLRYTLKKLHDRSVEFFFGAESTPP